MNGGFSLLLTFVSQHPLPSPPRKFCHGLFFFHHSSPLPHLPLPLKVGSISRRLRLLGGAIRPSTTEALFFFYHRLKKKPLFFTTALAAILKRWSQRSGSRVSRPCVEQVTAKAGAVVKRTRVQPPETRNQTNRGPRSRRCSRPAGSRRSTDGQRHAAGFGAARAPKTVATRAAHGRDLTSSLPSPTEREEELG